MTSPFAAAGEVMLARLFESAGHPAIHQPGGSATPCRLVWDAPQIQSGFTQGGPLFSEAGRSAIARVAELAAIGEGDVFDVSGDRWIVVGDPVHPADDPERLLWHLILTEDV